MIINIIKLINLNKKTLWSFLVLLLWGGFCLNLWADVHYVKNGSNLQFAIDKALSNDTLFIDKGTFSANKVIFTDSLCGNCQQHQTNIKASYGFIIKDKSLCLIGSSRQESRLITNAGYGLYILNSPKCEISNLTISGGIRDSLEMASDGAIVIRHSNVVLEYLDIINNNHEHDSAIAGIGGVIGREGAEIRIEKCNIINNSWDGIALYRGAVATVTDCLIKNGRGAGIGVTWDASCTAYRNIVTGYWKGIGSFGTSWVVARNNAVYDNLGWGIIASGNSFMDVCNNVVHHNGNCGVAIWGSNASGRFINNIITENGWKEHWVCPCVGVYNYGDWSRWIFSYNLVWNNKEGNYHDIPDQTGLNDNISLDPEFSDASMFVPDTNSPVIDAGYPEISDPDGSRSDIGLFGGPQAKSDFDPSAR